MGYGIQKSVSYEVQPTRDQQQKISLVKFRQKVKLKINFFEK
jgi:hypothetical protein